MTVEDHDDHEPNLLSPPAIAILKFNADRAYRVLVPGAAAQGDAEVLGMLRSITSANLLEDGRGHPLLDVAIGAMWLWHDFIDEAHKISQDNESPEGSWLHAIVHRREGDFSNSKYWYARCASLAQSAGGRELVDLVASVHDKPNDPRYATASSQQRAEWRALFKHCVRSQEPEARSQ